MRKLFLASAVCMVLGVSYPAISGGIPVIDGASIINQIQGLNQDIQNYEQYLKQTILSQEELANALKQYDQMLSDYQQVMREARALQGRIEGMNPEEWLSELAKLSNSHDPLYGSLGIQKNTGYKPWDDAVERNRLLNGYGMTDEEYDQMLVDIPFSGDDRNRAQQVFEYRQRKVAEGITRDAYIISLQGNLAEQAITLAQMDRRRLENQSDNNLTASVQFLTEQNQQLLYQMHNMQTQSAEQMKFSDRLADHYFNNMAKSEERRLQQQVEGWKNEN